MNAVHSFMRMAFLSCLTISLLFSLPLKAQYSGETLLKDVRYRMGMYTKLEDYKVYALAECKGPSGEFTTLVISDINHTRFEQKAGPRHNLGLRTNEAAISLVTPLARECEVSTCARIREPGIKNWLSLVPATVFSTVRPN